MCVCVCDPQCNACERVKRVCVCVMCLAYIFEIHRHFIVGLEAIKVIVILHVWAIDICVWIPLL